MPRERHSPLPPTMRSRRLAAELRRLREAAGLTREQVAAETGINQATLYRHECVSSRTRPQRRTMLTLLKLYGVGDQKRDELLELCREDDTQTWLRPYHAELPEQYTAYISFEAEAGAVRNYESHFIPGLLQTPDYARALIKGCLPTATARQIEHRVEARLERQTRLVCDDPLNLWVIVDEAALRRQVGGPEVMRRQLQRLARVAMAGRSHITIQVIPFAAGAHPGMGGSFVLLDFPPHPGPELVYIDGTAGDAFLDTQEHLDGFSRTFDALRARALSPDDSIAMIASLAGDRL